MKVGDLLHDNDPRMQPRTLKVVDFGVSGKRVLAEDHRGRQFRIAQHRIFSDGKKRRGGYTLEVTP